MSKHRVDLDEAKDRLIELAQWVVEGDAVQIALDDGRVIKLIIDEPFTTDGRVSGLHKGEGWVSEDFNEPLPDEFWSGVDK